MFFSQLLYLNIATLLPQFVDDNFKDINSLEVGIMFAAYQIAFIIVAPLIGSKLDSIGRRNTLFIAIGMAALSTFVFGMASLISNAYGFYFVSTIARLVQGAADAAILVTISSIIALEYPEKIEAYMGLVNMALGVGLASGPAFTTFLEIWFDYMVIEFIFSGFIIVTGIAASSVVPTRIDEERHEEGEE